MEVGLWAAAGGRLKSVRPFILGLRAWPLLDLMHRTASLFVHLGSPSISVSTSGVPALPCSALLWPAGAPKSLRRWPPACWASTPPTA